jgi:hypothetical protein
MSKTYQFATDITYIGYKYNRNRRCLSKKYISDIIVNNKTKLKAIEIQSLSIIFIFLLKISKV